MKKEICQKKVEQMIFCGLTNLFRSQDVLDLDQFSVVTLECLILLERESYLKNQENIGSDIGNGSYLRSFKSLSKHHLQIKIPRTRNGSFQPLLFNLLHQNQSQRY